MEHIESATRKSNISNQKTIKSTKSNSKEKGSVQLKKETKPKAIFSKAKTKLPKTGKTGLKRTRKSITGGPIDNEDLKNTEEKSESKIDLWF